MCQEPIILVATKSDNPARLKQMFLDGEKFIKVNGELVTVLDYKVGDIIKLVGKGRRSSITLEVPAISWHIPPMSPKSEV